ncbi:hypothetical protein [Campylobacter cuniculorum]|uniref:hypothetical protein n=1 Tax=Campylobacter cuniculorum TaxID=374106 RepID=UPI0023F56EE6|nr:hypothetical protein [Campylobacter cuniculorum]
MDTCYYVKIASVFNVNIHQIFECNNILQNKTFKIELVSSKEAGIYQALNQINEIYGSKLEIKEMSDVKTILDRGEGRLKW